MINVTDLRAGITFEDNGQIYQVLSYEHVKVGRGSANIKLKVQNLKTGATTYKSFINGAKVNPIELTKKPLQYLYKDESCAYFMDPKTFEQIGISLQVIPEYQLLKEGEVFSVSMLEDELFQLNLPPKMEFTVLETGPATRGNSAVNIYKDAILENGLKTKVPLFVKEGDRIMLDTRTLQYHEKTTK